jgi:soluble lytic murein transglycosylase
MAGRGTGLPGSGGDAVSTLVDTRSYGAAEQARADGLALAARGVDKLQETLRPAANEEAATLAAQRAAAGEFEQRLTITSMDGAYNEAMRRGTMARLAVQRDADLDQLRVQHAFDPDAYNAAAAEYRTNALNGAVPGALAVDWGLEFDERSNRNLGVIRGARAEVDLREAKDNLTAQTTRLIDETVSEFQGAPLAEAWEDAGVQANLVRAMSNIDALESNPAFGVSAEEAAALRLDVVGKIKAGAARSYVTRVLRDEGAPAALAAVQNLLTAEGGYSSQAERDTVVSAARAAVTDEITLENQRRNQVESERSAREQEGSRRIQEDIARLALTGESTGLTEDEVRAYGGDDFVLRWRKGMADAVDQRELFRDLPADPEEAAIEIARRASQQGFESLPSGGDVGDLDTVAAAIEQVESAGVNGLVSEDPDGDGPAGGGAFGVMQVLPETARGIAARLGLPFDETRLRTDRAYNRQIGRQYLADLTTRYRGDTFLAITAYHAGEGNVDGWLSSVGDPRSGNITREAWLDGIESRGNPRSAEYPRKVLRALQGGRASAAWDQHRSQQAGVLADPAESVKTQPDVRAAFALMGEARNGRGDLAEAGETLVTAYISAQERANVPANRRRALPMRELVSWAGYLARNEADPRAFQAATDTIIETFGERGGERVIRDALIVRGNTEFASQVAAATVRAARAGTPPPAPSVVAGAQRGQTVTRAASGSGNVEQASTEDLRRAAGFSD